MTTRDKLEMLLTRDYSFARIKYNGTLTVSGIKGEHYWIQ